MKKLALSIASCMIFGSVATAQTSDRRLAIGINTGISDYHGELDQNWFNTGHAWRGSVGLTAMYALSPWFNFGADASYGRLGHHVPGGGGIRTNMTQVNGQLRLKFNNGSWMREDATFQPYVYIGGGFATFGRKNENLYVPGTDLTANAGAGFAIMANDWLGFTYNLNYAYTNRDNRDGIERGYNDQFMIHSVGTVFYIGHDADTDGDGVIDKKDMCPGTPAGVKVDPRGCPLDTDKDGVADYTDDCPEIWGLADKNGCPDTDADGIIDREDACPEVAGLAQFNGCPDTDGDGITDADDRCPLRRGSARFQGCPDSDYDGIADIDDKCPYIFGVKENDGCPERTEEQFNFSKLLEEVKFDFDEATLKAESFPALDKIAAALTTNEFYYIIVTGHADAKGTEEYNKELSVRRAETVEKYLVSKGVAEGKIITRGFGEELPEETNATEEGRAENRRVEFAVKF